VIHITKNGFVHLKWNGCDNDKKTWALDLAPLSEIAALPFRQCFCGFYAGRWLGKLPMQ
jgi:hypothetical protein